MVCPRYDSTKEVNGNINNFAPSRRAAPSPRSGRVAKQRELAKRVVAKQRVCEADKERAAQLVFPTACASSGLCGVIFLGSGAAGPLGGSVSASYS